MIDSGAGRDVARDAALDVLIAVDERLAYLQPAMDAAAKRGRLDRRDRALALELAGGVLRWRRRLDYALEPRLRRGFEHTPPRLCQVLRLGAYQLLMLDRIPPHAAVHAAVEQARRRVGEGTTQLVNAVLRGLLRDGETLPRGEAADAIAVRVSHPTWLVDLLVAEHGPEFASLALEAHNRPAPLMARAVGAEPPVEDVVARLTTEGARVERGRYAPRALALVGHPNPFCGESFTAGTWTAQDEASQLVTHLLDPQPGEQIWDACAAPGGKARHIAELVGAPGRVIATDIHGRKADRMARELADVPWITARRHDAGRGMPAGAPLGGFDRVLVDAPCSALGVIRRHPEIRWRRSVADVERAAARQSEILGAVADAVRPGGVLVYSVCTWTDAEGPSIVAAFLAGRPDFQLVQPASGRIEWPQLVAGDAMRTWPHIHGCDAFFAARLHRIPMP